MFLPSRWMCHYHNRMCFLVLQCSGYCFIKSAWWEFFLFFHQCPRWHKYCRESLNTRIWWVVQVTWQLQLNRTVRSWLSHRWGQCVFNWLHRKRYSSFITLHHFCTYFREDAIFWEHVMSCEMGFKLSGSLESHNTD